MDATETVKKKLKNEIRTDNLGIESFFDEEYQFLTLKDSQEDVVNSSSGIVEDFLNHKNFCEDKRDFTTISLEKTFEQNEKIDNGQETGASVIKSQKGYYKICPASRKPKDFIDKRFSKKDDKGMSYS